jgi:hypothetical protein
MFDNIKRYVPLNWAIITPYNLLIVTLVLWISGLGLALIFHPSNGTAEPEK